MSSRSETEALVVNGGIGSRLLSYIPEIDGLRAIAVLVVFVHHLRESWLPGGFVGVDVFFVISGYVISKSLATSTHQNLRQYLANFYARRITRILPALLFCLAVTIIATLLFIPQSWLSKSIPDTGIWAIFGAANIALLDTNDGYFAPQADFNPFTHTWSLGVEEQFYLLFPLLFFMWMRFRSVQRRGLNLIAWGILALASLISLVLAAIFSTQNPDRSYYSLLSRFWELGAGALLFQYHYQVTLFGQKNGVRVMSRRVTKGFLIVGLVLISLGFWYSQPSRVPYPFGILPVAGTLLILHALGLEQQPDNVLTEWLASTPMRWLGRLSYSLYLWHWPVIVLMRWTVGIDRLEQILQAAILSLLLAMLSYYGIENPIRTNPLIKGLRSPIKIAVGLAMVLLLVQSSSVAFENQNNLSLSVTREVNDWYPSGAPAMAPSDSNGSKPLNGKTIFVVGNSHAGAYRQMLMQVKNQLGLRVVIDDQQQCAMGRLSNPVQGTKGCLDIYTSYLARLKKEAHAGDLVFLASFRLPRFRDQWAAHAASESDLLNTIRSAESQEKRDLGLEETAKLIAKLHDMGLQVMIDLPKPIFKSPPFRCSDWFNRENPVCELGFDVKREFINQLRQPIVDQIIKLHDIQPDLVIWDPLPALCPGVTCHAFANGKPLFFDGDHLSGYGNQVLYKSFVQVLSKVWSELLSTH